MALSLPTAFHSVIRVPRLDVGDLAPRMAKCPQRKMYAECSKAIHQGCGARSAKNRRHHRGLVQQPDQGTLRGRYTTFTRHVDASRHDPRDGVGIVKRAPMGHSARATSLRGSTAPACQPPRLRRHGNSCLLAERSIPCSSFRNAKVAQVLHRDEPRPPVTRLAGSGPA
jgi:hypothetical protein